jgi:NhaA family Na+:H+ antiporter
VHLDFAHIGEVFNQRVTWGIILGLLVGKQLGIFGASWLTVKLKFAELPQGVSWLQIYGVTWLAGIGFTMSLFIGGLAFPVGHDAGHGGMEVASHTAEYLAASKVGTLCASIIAGVGGTIILMMSSPLPDSDVDTTAE